MSYDIRKATFNDIPHILEIIELVVSLMQADGNYQWSKTYPGEKDFINDISDEVLWVASTEQGDVHGCIAITMHQGEDYGAVWDISQKAVVPHRLAVHPKAQGKGLAKKLLSQVEEIAKTNGCLSVTIKYFYLLENL